MGTGKHVKTEEFIEQIRKVRVGDVNAASLGMGKADEVYRKLLRYQAEAKVVLRDAATGRVLDGSLRDSSGAINHLPPSWIPGGSNGFPRITWPNVRVTMQGRIEPTAPFVLNVHNEEELAVSLYQLPDRIDIGHPFYSVHPLYPNREVRWSSFVRPGALKALATRLGVDEEDLEGKPFVYALEGNSYRLKTELLVEPPSKSEPKPLSFLEQFDKMRANTLQ
jgi:hypothetical protein